MTVYFLDTDTVSLAQHSHPVVARRILGCAPPDIAMTVISIEEQLSGWYTELRKARTAAELARIYQHITDTVGFFSHLQIISFNEQGISIFESLKKRRLGVANMDLRIAAIALERGAILVTRNRRDFERVPGLQIEDWTV